MLAQLFRHKSASPVARADSPRDAAEIGADVRGVGAIAAAAGVRTEHGMPAEFALPLGELMSRVPPHCLWPGRHDGTRVLGIPAADLAPGLARGKAELSLSRLVALAPEVFRWERIESEDLQVRLPIQKLLQQIRREEAASHSPNAPVSPVVPSVAERTQPSHDDARGKDSQDLGAIVSEQTASIFPARQEEPVATKADEPAEAVANPRPEPPPLSVTPEPRPTISITATEPSDRPVELRPPRDVSISSTLRAVVLGGITPAPSTDATTAAGQILAPRVQASAAVVPPPLILGPSVVASKNEGGISLGSRTAPDFAGLQNLFMTAATLDLSGVTALAASLPGVSACVISGTAGSATAGDFSHGVSAEELRMASANLARIGGAVTDTLHRGASDIALFLHDEVCVAVLVAAGAFVPGVRERLARVAELLAGTKPPR